MALRAMRDKKPLDYNTYMAYGEIYATLPGKKEAKKGWDYHCGHYYKTFSEYVRTVFSDGEIILKRVDEKFADRFGEKSLDILQEYLKTDFNLISGDAF